MKTLQQHLARVLCAVAFLGLAACSPDEGSADTEGQAGPDSVIAELNPIDALLADLPPQARSRVGAGQPRTGPYWVRWSTCGGDSQAATAAANGGREAGWLLVDDVLEDPGIALGDWTLSSCEEAVRILGDDAPEPAAMLPRQLLTAELNLTAGAATCGLVQELMAAGHTLLASQRYEGLPMDTGALDGEVAQSMDRAADLLEEYNAGRLCR